MIFCGDFDTLGKHVTNILQPPIKATGAEHGRITEICAREQEMHDLQYEGPVQETQNV